MAGWPQRRASEREHDLADVLALLEQHPQLRSPQLSARVQAVRDQILDAGLDGQAEQASLLARWPIATPLAAG